MNIDDPEFDTLTSVKVTDASSSNHTATWSGSVLQKSCRQEVCIKKPDAEGYCSRSENDSIWTGVANLFTGNANCKCKKKLPGKTIIKVVVTSDLKLKVYNT